MRDLSPMVSNRRVYLMAAACIGVLALSILIPRFTRDPGGGFAAATTAALTFFALGVAAAIASLTLLVTP